MEIFGVAQDLSANQKADKKQEGRPNSEKREREPGRSTNKGGSAQQASAQHLYRPSYPAPQYDLERLHSLGIERYASKHFVLYTDIDPNLARPLPPLMDQAYAAWEEYFGPLPPDRDGSDYQIVGYIMSNREAFRAAGILTDEIRIHLEGVYRNQVFWMNDQKIDYDRRHLMIHEGTHCYMSAIPNPARMYPWYMEGMADLFRTHTTDAEGNSKFRVFPTDRVRFTGLGRTPVIEAEVRKTGPRRLIDVANLRVNDFQKYDAYSWSWAACAFLDGHPKYRERYRHVGRMVIGEGEQTIDLPKTFGADWNNVAEEWLVFAGNVCYGYDVERTMLDMQPGTIDLQSGRSHEVDVLAGRGWQNSGTTVQAGEKYRVTADGQCVLASEPKPWESTPRGISIRYHAGQPIGKLLATIRTPKLSETAPYTSMLKVYPIGHEVEFIPEVSGTVYFRINDFWGELADNTGNYRVKISGGK